MPTLNRWWTKRVTMPRWAIFVDAIWRIFLALGAITVIVLWYQAATRDEEADRNAQIQSCSSVYAATYSAWDAEAQRLFGILIAAASADDDINPADVESYRDATANTAELARRRIGLGLYAADSVEAGNGFQCPVLPQALMVQAISP